VLLEGGRSCAEISMRVLGRYATTCMRRGQWWRHLTIRVRPMQMRRNSPPHYRKREQFHELFTCRNAAPWCMSILSTADKRKE
jgi:hypothetical protein